MVDLDELWRVYARRLGMLATRPDFRFDPTFVPMALRTEAAPDRPVPTNLFQESVGRKQHLPQLLLQIMTPSALKTAVEKDHPGAAELAFELLVLGHGIDAELSDFSADHYSKRYAEVAAAGIVPLVHYFNHGMAEGRETLRKLRKNFIPGTWTWDQSRPTLIVALGSLEASDTSAVGLQLVKDASKTHNVIVVALADGPLTGAFCDGSCCVFVSDSPMVEAEFAIGHWLRHAEFAILVSVGTTPFIGLLIENEIPFCAVVDEYAPYCLPASKAQLLATYADFLVYGSHSVRESWRGVHQDAGLVTETDSLLLPPVLIPPPAAEGADQLAARRRLSDILGFDVADRRIVFSAGAASWRKGSDLFVMTAQMAHDLDPEALFIMIGHGPNSEDASSGIWIDHHLQVAGANRLDGYLFTLPDGPHFADLCMAADVMMVASRIDPLPSVAVDAIQTGCDVVIFTGVSGFDDPAYDSLARLHSVAFGRLDLAARLIAGLPLKSERAAETSAVTRANPTPPRVFDTVMATYKDRVAKRGHYYLGGGHFDLPVVFSMAPKDANNRIKERQQAWNLGRKSVWKSPDEARHTLIASPFEVHQGSTVCDYRQESIDNAPEFSLHLHAFYTDELSYDLNRFVAFRRAKRIVVTTDTPTKANLIHAIGKSSNLSLDVLIVPNQGRDILPFLKLFYSGSGLDDGVWGHVHQKKCIGSSLDGDKWRTFMQRLVLGDEEFASPALTTMADTTVGLSAPFDPYINGWYGSRRLLPMVAPRIGIALPPHPILFTVGNMFWTRPQVVKKMISYFGETFPYPHEPISNDGTVFHLIERLWPTAAADCGLRSVFVCKPDEPRR